MRKFKTALAAMAAGCALLVPTAAQAEPAMSAEVVKVACDRHGDTKVTVRVLSPKPLIRTATFYWQTDHSGFGAGAIEAFKDHPSRFSVKTSADDLIHIQVYRGFTIHDPLLDTTVAAIPCD